MGSRLRPPIWRSDLPKSVFTPEYRRLLELLMKLRHDKGMTQQAVARKLRKHQSFVSKYERGERRLDVIELFQVVEALGYDPESTIRRFRGKSR